MRRKEERETLISFARHIDLSLRKERIRFTVKRFFVLRFRVWRSKPRVLMNKVLRDILRDIGACRLIITTRWTKKRNRWIYHLKRSHGVDPDQMAWLYRSRFYRLWTSLKRRHRWDVIDENVYCGLVFSSSSVVGLAAWSFLFCSGIT